MSTVWIGAEHLREYLVLIETLRYTPSESEALGLVADGLREHGQVRPVLFDGSEIVARQHIVEAAAWLGWTHVAVRLEASELALDDVNQMTLIDEVERKPSESKLDDIEALARKTDVVEVSDAEVGTINEESAAAATEWVGLPEFIGADEPFKVVISCENETDREALFDVLGIATIHKGTRGTLSVWWPDRKKKDLASLRFDEA